jgi:putative methyltransferase (TIGR04325 family)
MKNIVTGILSSKPSRQILERLRRAPLIREGLKSLYDVHFATASERKFRGVYATFDEAAKMAPKTKPLGYNNPESATMFVENYRIINPCDYPVLFWLKDALDEASSLFDLGGNVGISFYSYQKYLTYPSNLSWIVYEVPKVAEQGRQIATKEKANGLAFTTNLESADGVDILLAAGSLQFVEQPLSEILCGLRDKPKHLIINKTPMRGGEQFVTLQALGTAFCPYHIFNRTTFISSICAIGYELIDSWDNAEVSCHIPLHPEHSVSAYSGLYFRRSVHKEA